MLPARFHHGSFVRCCDLFPNPLMRYFVNPFPIFSRVCKFVSVVDPVLKVIAIVIYQTGWSMWQCSKTNSYAFQRSQTNVSLWATVISESLGKIVLTCCCFYANNFPNSIITYKLLEKSFQSGCEAHISGVSMPLVFEEPDKLHTPFMIVDIVRRCSYCSAGLVIQKSL